MMLPTDAQERKNIPIYTGFMVYFPLAIVEVTKVSVRGNEQHNPGSDLHWDRGKSKDERDSQARHLLDQTAPCLSLDDEIKHAAAGTWRAMANLQKLCEQRAEDEAALQRIEGATSDLKYVSKLLDKAKRQHIDAVGEGSAGQTVRTAGPVELNRIENSESKKIASTPGQWWRGIDEETVDEFHERCAPGSSEPSTRQRPRPLL